MLMDEPSLIRKISSLIIILFAGMQSSFAQNMVWEPSYMNISVNDGLPSSETYYVHQDRGGNLWFCTDHGVVRYDGFRLHVFINPTAFPMRLFLKL